MIDVAAACLPPPRLMTPHHLCPMTPQETMCREWYTLLLRPWAHYVPVDYHFKGLRQAAAWALCPAANFGASEAAARRARRFADAVLTRRTATSYAAALLRRWGDAQARWQEGREDGDKSALDTSDRYPSESAPAYLVRTRPFERF